MENYVLEIYGNGRVIDERGGEESDDGGDDFLYRDSEEEEDNSCTEDEEDDEEATLGSTLRGQGRRREGRRARPWASTSKTSPLRPGMSWRCQNVYSLSQAVQASLVAEISAIPWQYNFHLFCKPIRALMKVYTNRCCHLLLSKAVHPACLDGWKDVSDADLDVFSAILIFMGIKDMPCEKMYWSQGGVWEEPFVRAT